MSELKLKNDYPLTYFGNTPIPYQAADAVIVPVPYEGTVSFGHGTSEGPRAIRIASRQVETYLPERGVDIFDVIKLHSLDDLEPCANGPRAMIDLVRQTVDQLINAHKLPILIGGEHSISLGSVESLISKHPNLTVIQIDAHGDLRDSYQGSKFSHACVMRRIRELAPAVQVGIRNLSEDCHAYLKENKLESMIFSPDRIDTERIISLCPGPVYITVDLDGIDPSIMPAVGTPEPDGLSWAQIVSILSEIFLARWVVGFDIVELAPLPGNHAPNFIAAKLLLKMIENYRFSPHWKA